MTSKQECIERREGKGREGWEGRMALFEAHFHEQNMCCSEKGEKMLVRRKCMLTREKIHRKEEKKT